MYQRLKSAAREMLRIPRGLPAEAIDEFSYTVFSDDIFLCTFPRSGNTWMRYLLAHCIDPATEWTLQSLNLVVPDIHTEHADLPVGPRPRIFKTHFLPSGKYPRVIYVVRDGRDAAVSYYDYEKKLSGYQSDLESFVQELCGGTIWPSSWHVHVLSWVKQERVRPFLLVRYEDMVEDPFRELKRVLQFAGIDRSDQIIKAAVEQVTVQLIWRESQEVSSLREAGFKGGVSGRSGKWRETFSDELNHFFLKKAGKAMRRCGYIN